MLTDYGAHQIISTGVGNSTAPKSAIAKSACTYPMLIRPSCRVGPGTHSPVQMLRDFCVWHLDRGLLGSELTRCTDSQAGIQTDRQTHHVITMHTLPRTVMQMFYARLCRQCNRQNERRLGPGVEADKINNLPAAKVEASYFASPSLLATNTCWQRTAG